MFSKITILGPGLLGASLMQAVKAKGVCPQTAAWSRRPETRMKCEQAPWCDEVGSTASQAIAGADLVIICTPVETIVPLIEEIAPQLQPGTLITDVGSTKSLICRQGHAATPPHAHFIGAHPMAGSEKTGMQHASAELFANRTCLVTPLIDSDKKATDTIVKFWNALGMDVTTTSPESHDEIVAHISHLPHVLASILCAYLGNQNDQWGQVSGNGLRDTTRIASGDPGLWKSIITQNKEEILRALNGFEKEMDQMRSAIHNNNPLEIKTLLERGKQYRDRLKPLAD